MAPRTYSLRQVMGEHADDLQYNEEQTKDDFDMGLDDCDSLCHYDGIECDKCSHCVNNGCYATQEGE